MLRTVIITTASGVVLFEKEWVDSKTKNRGRMFGQLLTSMQEFARQATGLRVAYLAFHGLALSLVTDPNTRLVCTLFHDLEDGEDFGRTIARQILKSFLEEFTDVKFSGPGLNVSRFSSFAGRLYEAISSATRAILTDLQMVKGITNALVVDEDGRPITAASDEDPTAIVANLVPVMTLAHDIMGAQKDKSKMVTIAMSRQTVYAFILGDVTLVAVCRKSVPAKVYMDELKKSGNLISQVFALSESLVS